LPAKLGADQALTDSSKKIDAGFLKICITPLLVVCSLHLQQIIEFYLCIQMLPVNVSLLHFSWTTLYIN